MYVPVVAGGNRRVDVDDQLVVQGSLLDERQDEGLPAPAGIGLAGGGREPPKRQRAVGVVMVVHCDADLAQVVRTLRPPSGFAGRLHGRQQQGDEHPDNGNDYK